MDEDEDPSSPSSNDDRVSPRSPTHSLPGCSTPKKDICSHGNLPLLFPSQDPSDSECSKTRQLSVSEVTSPLHAERSKISGSSYVSECAEDVSGSAYPTFSITNSPSNPVLVHTDAQKPRKPLHTFTRAGLWKRLKRHESQKRLPVNFPLDVSTFSSESPLMSHSSHDFEISIESSSAAITVEGLQASSLNISNIACSSREREHSIENQSQFVNEAFNSSFPSILPLDTSTSGPIEYHVIEHESEDDESGDDLNADIFEPPKDALHPDSESAEDSESDPEDEEYLAYCKVLKLDDRLAIDKHIELKEFLRNWALKNGISLSSLSELCTGLSEVHPQCFSELRKDARTILQTPTQALGISTVDSGEYLHIGIRKQMNFIFSLLALAITAMPLLFNIDGVKLYNNSTSSLWTILMTLPTVTELINKVFPIGLYYGKRKPADAEAFLKRFVDELLEILINGYTMDGVQRHIEILGFVCDVPARTFILGTVGHTGFYSCFRCTTKGLSKDRRRVFPNLDAPLREDAKFRLMRYKRFQTKETPLLKLPMLDFTKSFVCDSVHLVFIGVCKGLLTLWFKGKRPHRLSPGLRVAAQVRLDRCYYHIPAEFSRRPRDFKNLSIWKATEMRLFLLYVGPVVLKGILGRNQYLHFLELSTVMIIYHSPILCAVDENRSYAKAILHHFADHIKLLYGKKYVSHNCHSLIHIHEDVEYFIERIPNFHMSLIGAWPFENFNQIFTKYTRGRNKPLQQLGRRIGELFSSQYWRDRYSNKKKSEEGHLSEIHDEGPTIPSCKGLQFKTAQFSNFKLKIDRVADCVCGAKNGDVIYAKNFIHDRGTGIKYVVGQKFEHKSNFFGEPLVSSQVFGISTVSNLGETLKMWPLSEIIIKFVFLPSTEDEFVIFPLLHADLTPTHF